MAGKKRKEFRLITGSLTKNCCKDRSGDGCICGSVFEEVTRNSNGKIISAVCFPNGHKRPIRRPKTK